VLLAEDHPMNQELTRKRLREMGCVVDVVTTGSQAVDAACASDFDLIVMDVRMPGLNGIQATKKIRENRGIDNGPPIIAVTADTSSATREECLAAGVTLVLAKPTSRTTLLHSVFECLGLPLSSEFTEEKGATDGDDELSEFVRLENRPLAKNRGTVDISELINRIDSMEEF
jgi:hypothetical protein